MLRGEREHWRIRVGDWRIIYTIEDERLLVIILRLAIAGKSTDEERAPHTTAARFPRIRILRDDFIPAELCET